MTNLQILESFEREINKFDDSILKPDTDTSLYWLNQAVQKFVKLRYNSDFVHKTGYEETEKRYRDLVKLLEHQTYSRWDDDPDPDYMIYSPVDHGNYTSYSLSYPEDMLYTLSETVNISKTRGEGDTTAKWVPVFECTADSFMYRINNSLTDFHYRNQYARPLRVRSTTGCHLLTDGKYVINKYALQYLRKPNKISLTYPFNEYIDFDNSVLYEIIKIAAQMYIENTADKRYETISNEVNTQE